MNATKYRAAHLQVRSFAPKSSLNYNLLNRMTAVSNAPIGNQAVFWAVGYYQENNVFKTLAIYWYGNQWTTVPTPNGSTGDTYLSNIAGNALNNIWAVGDYGSDPTRHTMVQHWDGANWTIAPSQDPGTGLPQLYGVSVLPSGAAWAVGQFDYQTLTEQLSSVCGGN